MKVLEILAYCSKTIYKNYSKQNILMMLHVSLISGKLSSDPKLIFDIFLKVSLFTPSIRYYQINIHP